MSDKFNPVNSVIDDAVEAAERTKNREIEQLRAALMGAVEALENCDRHIGLFCGERAKLEKAREALKTPHGVSHAGPKELTEMIRPALGEEQAVASARQAP